MSSPTTATPCRLEYRRGLAIASTVLAVAVFPLIFVGAGVTSQDAGMAFPDWPTSNNHLVNPPNWLQENDKLWEHGHRLIGWLVGMLAIVVAALSLKAQSYRRLLGISTLLAIIAQGVLGGLRVWEVSTILAMTHGIFGQICFCLTCTTALVNSKTWTSVEDRRPAQAVGFLQKLCLATTTAVFLQLATGAALRHFLSNPATIAHIVWAIVVAMLVGWVAMWLIGQYDGQHAIGALSRVLAFLMVSQLFLGGFAFIVVILGVGASETLRWTLPSAHVAVGALLLVCTWLITLCTFRMLEESKARNESIATPVVAT